MFYEKKMSFNFTKQRIVFLMIIILISSNDLLSFDKSKIIHLGMNFQYHKVEFYDNNTQTKVINKPTFSPTITFTNSLGKNANFEVQFFQYRAKKEFRNNLYFTDFANQENIIYSETDLKGNVIQANYQFFFFNNEKIKTGLNFGSSFNYANKRINNQENIKTTDDKISGSITSTKNNFYQLSLVYGLTIQYRYSERFIYSLNLCNNLSGRDYRFIEEITLSQNQNKTARTSYYMDGTMRTIEFKIGYIYHR